MARLYDAEIPASWQFVRQVKTQLEAALADYPPSLRYAVGMVASELAGNAIKYSDPSLRVSAHISCEIVDDQIMIEVMNPVSSADLVDEVKRRIDQLTDATSKKSKETLFLNRLKEFLDGAPKGSQLGLYRIGYEGDFDLSYSYENSLLTVKARRGLSG